MHVKGIVETRYAAVFAFLADNFEYKSAALPVDEVFLPPTGFHSMKIALPCALLKEISLSCEFLLGAPLTSAKSGLGDL